MSVRVLPAAFQDLEEIETRVTENFGTEYAGRTYAKLIDVFALLADFPGMGRPRPDVSSRQVHFFHSKPYWIVYQPGTFDCQLAA